MLALVAAMRAPGFPAHPAVVISNRPDAPGLVAAADLGLATAAIDHKSFATRTEFDEALDAALHEAGAALVACAGFMRILGPEFARAWSGRALNIHPSLLPLFPGLDTHARALAAGVAIHGCTVHEITEALDSGPILGQAALAVAAGDTAETLADRVRRCEHALYPAVLAAYATDPTALRRAPIGLLCP